MQFESPTFVQPAIGLRAMPLFNAAWLFAAGIAISRWTWLRPSLLLAALTLAAALTGIAAVCVKRIAWLPLAAVWCLLGAWCASMEPHPAPAPALASLSDGLLRTVEGTVVDSGSLRGEAEPTLNDDGPATPDPVLQPSQRIDLQISSLETVTDAVDEEAPTTGGVRLTVQWPEDVATHSATQLETPPGIQLFQCGERVRAVVRLLQPETYNDPEVWSRQDFLLDQDVTSTASVGIEQVERLGQAESAWRFLACRVRGLQRAITSRLLALPVAMGNLPAGMRLTQSDSIMLAAMIAGDRTYLSQSLRVGFERTGSFHMLVVSGFHLAILTACIFWMTLRMRLHRVPATLITILISFAYALFSGFATPVQRSFWMVTLYLLGRLIYRKGGPLNTIGFAALCLLAVSPRSLFDSSLQMTLLAVIAIAGIAAPMLRDTIHPYLTATRSLHLTAIDAKLEPKIAQFRALLRMFASRLKVIGGEYLGEYVGWHFFPFVNRWFLRVVELVVVSCVIELGMTLPMAFYFHRITFFALPVNVLILPLLAVLIPASLVMLILVVVWPSAALVPAVVVAGVLHFGVWIVHLFGSLAFGDLRIAMPLVWQSAAFCGLFALAIVLAQLSTLNSGLWLRRLAWTALVLAALAAAAPRPIDHPHSALLVEAIDVGQGDSVLVITPDGKTLLVDGGGFGGGPHQAAQDFDIGEEVVSPALWARGIHHLDVVALSHAHSDHMGGLPAVLRNFHPDEFWVGNNPPVAAYSALLDEAAALKVRVRSLRAGDSIALGTSKIDVLAPFANYTPGAEPANNDSLVLHAGYGTASVLLEGDAEWAVEDAMLGEQGLKSTLLKVGHHGSVTSTRPEFLERVAPQWAVISCGLRNRYGHPRQEILEELQAAGVRTFRTDTEGASCFALDGKGVTAEPGCGRSQ